MNGRRTNLLTPHPGPLPVEGRGRRASPSRQSFAVRRGRRGGRVWCGFDGAEPVGTHDANGPDLQAMAFGVFNDRGRRIEAHWLVVQETGVKFGGVMSFQV